MTLEDEDEDELLDGKYEITASRLTFQHVYLANITVQVAAMDEINQKLKEIDFDGKNFTSPISYSFLYLQWEANKVMEEQERLTIVKRFVLYPSHSSSSCS